MLLEFCGFAVLPVICTGDVRREPPDHGVAVTGALHRDLW